MLNITPVIIKELFGVFMGLSSRKCLKKTERFPGEVPGCSMPTRNGNLSDLRIFLADEFPKKTATFHEPPVLSSIKS